VSDETRVTPPSATDPNATRVPATADTAGPTDPHATLQHQSGGAAHAPGRVQVPGYEILGELGRGGMGVVYRAKQVKLNRVVALKMVLAGGHASAAEVARFVAEAEAVAAVRHPNVIQVFDSGEADGTPFMAMEFLPGGSLHAALKAKGKLTPDDAARLMAKVARGVQAAHDRGIVHRDLKPHNVMLDETGEPKVMDFGLAKRGDGADLTTTGAVLGTPAYMAPEQARGETKLVGRASDVYALGVMLYECVSGTVPFQGRDPWSVIQQVVNADPEPVTRRCPGAPRELDLVCRKCMEKRPAERYDSASALADDLERYLRGDALTGPRTGFWYGARKSARRHWRALASVVALLALVVAAWLLPSPFDWFRAPQPPSAEPKPDAVAELLREEIAGEVDALRRAPPNPTRAWPHPVARVAELPKTDYSAFKVYEDRRVIDMRGWKPLPPNDPAAECSVVYSTRREMMKASDATELRIETTTTGREAVNKVERPNPETARAFTTDKPWIVGKQNMKVWQTAFDVSNVPVNQRFTLRYTTTYWNSIQAPADQWFGVIGYEGSVKATLLVLFPEGKPYRSYELKIATPLPNDPTKRGDPVRYTGPRIAFGDAGRTWLYWEVPKPQANTVYRVDWEW
jgi:eukaryotic-like serine/threonine-protein kinase